jgi:addiction module RelE/StbE family toxin
MKQVVFSPQAERDFESIADYIAQDNPRRAVTFVSELRKRCLLLGRHLRSARRFGLLGASAHILPYGNYVILYRNLATEVSIERIIHGARDILALVKKQPQ